MIHVRSGKVFFYYSGWFFSTGKELFNSQPLCVRVLAKVFHQLHRDFLVNYFYMNSIFRLLSIFILFLREWKAAKSTIGLRFRPVSQLPKAPNYKGLQDLAGIIEDMSLVNSGFHITNNYLENYTHLGTRQPKYLPALSLAKHFSLPGAPANIGPGLTKMGNLKTKQISFEHREAMGKI